MTHTRDTLKDVEEYRLKLEANVAKLKASLRHWQAWELEYEGMKEEVLNLQGSQTVSDLETPDENEQPLPEALAILLTREERRKITRNERDQTREPPQIENLLSRRLDYVQQNVKSIISQLRTAEEKLAASDVVSKPEVINEDGLPLTEIREELDEEGNVIASSISHPGKEGPDLLSNFEKDLPNKALDSSREASGHPLQDQHVRSEVEAVHGPREDSESTETLVTKSSHMPSTKVQGGVMDGKPGSMTTGVASNYDDEDDDEDDDEEVEIKDPVIPNNESAEKAALRQQMLRYNMEQVGAVVAEINIEDDDYDESDPGSENGNNPESSDEEHDYDDDTDEDDNEAEDMYGRTSTRVLSDDYVAEMRALEKKLQAQAMINTGPASMSSAKDSTQKANLHADSSAIAKAEGSPRNGKSAIKGVRFAEELQIQEPPPKQQTMPALSHERHVLADASDSIRERYAASEQVALAEDAKTRKPSRFKSARMSVATQKTNKADAASSLPEVGFDPVASTKKLHAEAVIERPFASTDDSKTLPRPPRQSDDDNHEEDIDTTLLDQQMRSEYHRLRNRQIYREGGFLAQNDRDQPEVPLTEEEGGPKKMSRFKAARLGKS